MAKRNRLEVIRDILKIIQDSHNLIKLTPLLRKSNLSSNRFYQYLEELIQKRLVVKTEGHIKLTENGKKYLERYSSIVNFIEEFGLWKISMPGD